MDELKPLDVDLPERVIDQLVVDSGFTYHDPDERHVYQLALAIKREVLARIPNSARAALSRQCAAPPGWKIVPTKATPEMVNAYLDANNAYWRKVDELPPKIGVWRNGTPKEATAASYQAMLAAAPSPSQCAAGEGEPHAWEHEEDCGRVISKAQKNVALRDGGASASSVRPYSIPLYACPLPIHQQKDDGGVETSGGPEHG